MEFWLGLKAVLTALPVVAGAWRELSELAGEIWKAVRADMEARQDSQHLRDKVKAMTDAIRVSRVEKNPADINRQFRGV